MTVVTPKENHKWKTGQAHKGGITEMMMRRAEFQMLKKRGHIARLFPDPVPRGMVMEYALSLWNTASPDYENE